MKIAITGATGFIGGHVIKHLAKLKYDVELISTNDFMAEEFGALGNDVDVVIHCAWPRKPLDSTIHLEFAERSCSFFKHCKKWGVKVINLGSSSEYGIKDKKIKESDICEPVTSYGIAKLSVTLFAKMLGFNTLRLFSVYGDGEKSFRSIYKKSIRYAGKSFVRHHISIEDVCRVIERMIHAQHLYGEIINIAGEEEYMNHSTLSRYIIKDPQYSTNNWDEYPQSQYEPVRWQANLDKMHRLINI